MKSKIIFLLLVSACLHAMESDDWRFYVCVADNNNKCSRLITSLAQNVAFSCELLKRSIEFDLLKSASTIKSFCIYVPFQFGSTELWEKLIPCLESPAHIKNILKSKKDLVAVFRAANYLEHQSLYEACAREWADRNYSYQEEDSLPMEMQGAVSCALLTKHNLINEIISCGVEAIKCRTRFFAPDHAHAIWTCAIGDQYNSVAAGTSDGDIHYWIKKKRGWKREVFINAHRTEGVGKLQFIDHDSKLISSANNAGIKILNLKTKTCIKSFGDEVCDGFFFAYDETQGLLAISNKEHEIYLYDLKKEEIPLVREFDGHDENIYALDFSPNQDLLASVAADQRFKLWDVSNGDLVADFQVSLSEISGRPNSLIFNQQGNKVAVGLNDGTIQIYDLERFCLDMQKERCHEFGIWRCIFCANDTLLISGSEDHKIKIWSLPNLELIREISSDFMHKIFFMDMHIERGQLLAGFGNGTLALIDLAPLLQAIQGQRNRLQSHLPIEKARFLVKAAQATKDKPLSCTKRELAVFNSFTKNARIQLLKHFAIAIPEKQIAALMGQAKGSSRKPGKK